MARASPSASPVLAGPGAGFGEAPQRKTTLRRRRGSSSGDDSDSSTSSGGEEAQRAKPSPLRKPSSRKASGGERSPIEKAPSRKSSKSVLGDQKKTLAAEKPKERGPRDDGEENGGAGRKGGTKAEDGVAPLPRKLSVAALIRSFSPRSRAKAKAAAAEATEAAEPPKPKPKTPRITFGTLKRASLSFPASPSTDASAGQRRASHSGGFSDPPNPPPALQQQKDEASSSSSTTAKAAPPVATQQPSTKGPTSPLAKFKLVVTTVAKDASRLKISIPPPPPPPTGSSPVAAVVDDQSFATGPGSLVDDVRSTLAKLITLLDGVDPRKLRAIRLGGELRGLLGKAADEVDAYADAFREHARASVGVAIALQNLAAALRQLFPIADKLRVAKFMLNRQFKRDVTFAFQEINSYYTSAFMELSMAVATRAGLELPLPTPVAPAPVVEEDDEEEEEETPLPTETPPAPDAARDALCLAAHRHFFGHACPLDLPRALALYKEAAALGCGVAMRCLGHMHLRGTGVEKDLFAAERWLLQAAEATGGESEDAAQVSYLLGCLLSERAPHQKSAPLTRECWARAQSQFARAAQLGLADAQFQLAASLERGDALAEKDEDKDAGAVAALPWYRRAAEQNHVEASAALGRLLLKQYDDAVATGAEAAQSDKHVSATASEAIHWLQRAAAAGEHAGALTLLGVVFGLGRRGAKRDVDRGVALLRRAAAAGSHEAMLHLATLLLRAPDDDKTLLATQDRADAHDEALRLLLTVAQSTSRGTTSAVLRDEANFQAGVLLYHSALLRDRAAALRFYLRAAQLTPPHALAARRAATMLYAGVGCARADKQQAHRWYAVAADAGDPDALNALGLMYEDGDGCDLDFRRAAACYRRAVELGSAHAHFNLGCLLAHGKGVPRNLDAAQAHFARALALGYTLARDFLRPES